MNNKSNYKKENGITLVGLIVTIIVILILAAITLMFAFGKNGVLTQTENSRIQTDIAREKELIRLEVYGSYGQDSPKLHIDVLDYNVRKNIPNTITDGSTEWPLKVTYTDSGRSYWVDIWGNIYLQDIKIDENFDKTLLVPNPDGDTPEEKGPYVNYIDANGNTILCRVFSNDGYNIEIISDDVLRNESGDVKQVTLSNVSDATVISTTNNIARSYVNREDGIALSARCIGSHSMNELETLKSLEMDKVERWRLLVYPKIF
jgi:urease beta subunit